MRRALKHFGVNLPCWRGHLRSQALFRSAHSRFTVALTTCKRCGRMLDAEGRKER